MAKIKIKDLPKDMKVSKEEMKTVMGGIVGDSGITRPFGILIGHRNLRRRSDNLMW